MERQHNVLLAFVLAKSNVFAEVPDQSEIWGRLSNVNQCLPPYRLLINFVQQLNKHKQLEP